MHKMGLTSDEEFTGLRAATDGGVKAVTGMMQQVRRCPAQWRSGVAAGVALRCYLVAVQRAGS